MKIEKFEDIKCWQESKELTFNIYRMFSKCNDFSFRDQIKRAVISIMNNIAEGFERQTNKELRNFLYISKGSCAEVRSMLYVALEMSYIDRAQFDKIEADCIRISKMLSSFIKTL